MRCAARPAFKKITARPDRAGIICQQRCWAPSSESDLILGCGGWLERSERYQASAPSRAKIAKASWLDRLRKLRAWRPFCVSPPGATPLDCLQQLANCPGRTIVVYGRSGASGAIEVAEAEAFDQIELARGVRDRNQEDAAPRPRAGPIIRLGRMIFS